uniref:Disease resistance RPP13-like protein 4 n=1 Tax=Nelumbo nucifera TaxID=4432 RepID=A0A822ZE58_NELNU|nr:TPA_asm: hypothetical protein HUJ06_001407 [Nelumbo nucifera]
MSSEASGREGFIRFHDRWSKAAEAINGSEKHSATVKEQIKRIDNDLKDIQRSLELVNKWGNSVDEVFKSLNNTIGNFIDRLQEETLLISAGSIAESQNNPVTKQIKSIAREVGKIKFGGQPLQRLPTLSRPEIDEKTDRTNKWQRLEKEEIMKYPAVSDARAMYELLDLQLKLCFLCLSIFPENEIIRKRSLVYWWIGEDFVVASGGKEVEEIGEECFKKLCESGLLEPIYGGHSRFPHGCKLHPWIRWMAIDIAKETMFFDFDSDGKPSSGSPCQCPRRACVATTKERRPEKVDLGQEGSELRSLFNIDVHFLECKEEDFKKLTNLTTLQLGRWKDKPKYHIEVMNTSFLDHLGLLKNLRFLGLQGISRITKLPDSIQELTELMVLDLRACHNLEELPAGIASLKKLTHFDVSYCYLLEYMPKGLGSLSDLQFLGGFVVSSLRGKEACKLSDLSRLVKLRKLSLSLAAYTTSEEELKALGNIKPLKSLTITWGAASSPVEKNDGQYQNQKCSTSTRTRKSTTSKQSTAISSFEISLPPSLTKLDLRCYPKPDAPKLRRVEDGTASEDCLKKLYFRGGSLSSLHGIEGKAVSKVEVIRLRFLQKFSMVKPDLERISHPHLKYVEIFNCRHIDESFAENGTGDGIGLDQASTSNTNANSHSPIFYKIVPCPRKQ